MNTERNCQSCDNYKNEYCRVLDMKPCYPEKGCDYFSEQKHEREQFIWIVTYWDFDSSEPVVTAFNNEETANKCYKYFKNCHSFCYLDKCPIYSRFLESEVKDE